MPLMFASSAARAASIASISVELLVEYFGTEITGADCIIIGLKRRQGADGTWLEGKSSLKQS